MSENNHPLAKWRADRDLTQEAVATELGVALNTIWRWENKKRAPRPLDAKRISDMTGISIGELIEASLPEIGR